MYVRLLQPTFGVLLVCQSFVPVVHGQAVSGPAESYVITQTPATGVWNGMSFSLYDKEFSSGAHTLVYGPLMSYMRRDVPELGLIPTIKRVSPNGDWYEAVLDIWPSEEVVRAYQSSELGASLRNAPLSRLPIRNVSIKLTLVGEVDPKTGQNKLLTLYNVPTEGAWEGRDPHAIRFRAPEGTFDEQGQLIGGGLRLVWNFEYASVAVRLADYVRLEGIISLSEELRKNLAPAADPNQTPISQIAVFAENEGALKRHLVRRIRLVTSPMSPERQDRMISRVEGTLLEAARAETRLTLDEMLDRDVAVYFEGISNDSQTFGRSYVRESLTQEVLESAIDVFDEVLEKVKTSRDSENISNKELHEKLRETLTVDGKSSASVLKIFSGKLNVKYDELSESERNEVDYNLDKLKQAYEKDGTTRHHLKSSEMSDKAGEIVRELVERRRYKLVVYNVAQLQSDIELTLGQEIVERQQDTVTKVDSYSIIGSQREEGLSPLDWYYQVPLGTILSTAAPVEQVSNSYFFQLCDGSELPSNSPLRDWGMSRTPDIRDQFIKGAKGNDVLASGGQGLLRRLETDSVSDHTHSYSTIEHDHSVQDITGSIANRGGSPGKHQYKAMDDNQNWGDRRLRSDGHPSNNEGQHRHDLPNKTGEVRDLASKTGTTGGEGGHSHTLPNITVDPPHVRVNFIMRVR